MIGWLERLIWTRNYMFQDYNFLKEVTKMYALKKYMAESYFHILFPMVNEYQSPCTECCSVMISQNPLIRIILFDTHSTTINYPNLQIMTLRHGKFKLLVHSSLISKSWIKDLIWVLWIPKLYWMWWLRNEVTHKYQLRNNLRVKCKSFME